MKTHSVAKVLILSVLLGGAQLAHSARVNILGYWDVEIANSNIGTSEWTGAFGLSFDNSPMVRSFYVGSHRIGMFSGVAITQLLFNPVTIGEESYDESNTQVEVFWDYTAGEVASVRVSDSSSPNSLSLGDDGFDVVLWSKGYLALRGRPNGNTLVAWNLLDSTATGRFSPGNWESSSDENPGDVYAGAFAFSTVSSVPVPAAAWLFGSALISFGIAAKCKKS